MDKGQIRQLALELAEAAILREAGKRVSLPGSDGLEPMPFADHVALEEQLRAIAEAVACDLAGRYATELALLNDALLLRRDSIDTFASLRQTGRRAGLEEAAGMVGIVATRLAGKGAGHVGR